MLTSLQPSWSTTLELCKIGRYNYEANAKQSPNGSKFALQNTLFIIALGTPGSIPSDRKVTCQKESDQAE